MNKEQEKIWSMLSHEYPRVKTCLNCKHYKDRSDINDFGGCKIKMQHMCSNFISWRSEISIELFQKSSDHSSYWKWEHEIN